MFPNGLNFKLKRQQGAALMLALFVILLAAGILAALANLRSNASKAVVYEVQGQRSYWLAKAQLELALVQLYPLNQASQACSVVSPSIRSWSTDSWQNCTSSIRCSETVVDSQRVIRLQSTASCGAGADMTSRVLTVEAAG